MKNEQDNSRTGRTESSIERKELAAIAATLPMRTSVKAGGKTIACATRCMKGI